MIIEFAAHLIYGMETPGFTRERERQAALIDDETALSRTFALHKYSTTRLPPVTMPLEGKPGKILCNDRTPWIHYACRNYSGVQPIARAEGPRQGTGNSTSRSVTAYINADQLSC